MNLVVEEFLSNVSSLHELKAKELPVNIIKEMAGMEADELYKLCTQLVVLQHNVPTKDKMINIDKDELLILVDKYAKELLERLRGYVGRSD